MNLFLLGNAGRCNSAAGKPGTQRNTINPLLVLILPYCLLLISLLAISARLISPLELGGNLIYIYIYFLYLSEDPAFLLSIRFSFVSFIAGPLGFP